MLVLTTHNTSDEKMSLRDDNYDVTESECPDCEEGDIWVNSFELVCDTCGVVFRKSNGPEIETKTPLEDFNEHRDEHNYYNSGRTIMPGGFLQAYPDADPSLSEDAIDIGEPYR